MKDIVALVNLAQKGRTALAVEALWDEVELISDWEGLLEVPPLDHSAAEENTNASRCTAKTASHSRGLFEDSICPFA